MLFDHWFKHHPCDRETLWHVQNALGTILGFDHIEAQAAMKAWENCKEIDVIHELTHD